MSQLRFATSLTAFTASMVIAALPAIGGHIADRQGPVHRRVSIQGASGRVNVLEIAGRITRIYGAGFSQGPTALDSAQSFLAANTALLSVQASDLVPARSSSDTDHLQPVVHEPSTGTHKFTAVRFRQERGGIPVYGAGATLVVRNEPRYPLVLVALGVRKVGSFVPLLEGINLQAGHAVAAATVPTLQHMSEPQLVIWAGASDESLEPVLATSFIGQSGDAASSNVTKRRFVSDARTGEILHIEDQIHRIDVEGSVWGGATDGKGPAECEPEVPMPMPSALVKLNSNMAYTESNGRFVIPNEGTEEVTVESPVRGRWFQVFNHAGPDTVLQMIVTPPGPADFLHNEFEDQEFATAEINGYVYANMARSHALRFNEHYPVIWDEEEFAVNVNINSHCGAYYDGDSINFFRAGAGCVNTAYAAVIFHEYGHHLVSSAGSGQGAYGEGMGDTLAVLIQDDPGFGYGLFGECSDVTRTADNDIQFPCDGDRFHCAQLLSGCVWDTRNELLITEPDDYRDVLSNLAVNAILLHTGEDITPAITVDYLTLDDDDGDILNGTPHYHEIAAGFGMHNMDAPPLDCPADLDGSGAVDFGDILAVLAAWDHSGGAEDLDGSGTVGFGDLLVILAEWGPCL